MKLSDIQKLTGGEIIGGDAEFSGAAYDSREAFPGCLFVCLPGERTDGHKYISSAASKGAVAAICSEKASANIPYILVPDTLLAFQSTAEEFAREHKLPTVAVTGSVGKTTTKEFISAVLSVKYRVHKTEGNRNSGIGLPATILNTPTGSNARVIEMGMSNAGEISVLSKIAHPDIAVISNIGFSHIEYLGSRENIMKAKLEIVDGLDKNGVLIVNGDDEYLSKINPSDFSQRVIFVGIGSPTADFRAEDILFSEGESRFLAVTENGSFAVKIPAEGIHNVYNALCAIAVGQTAGVSNAEIAEGLRRFTNAPLRQNIYELNGMTVIEDCYNASPASVTAALNILRSRNGRKIAVLGDMLELGVRSAELHEMTGEKLAGVDILIAFGSFSGSYCDGAKTAGLSEKNIYTCKNTNEAAEILRSLALPGDVILFKASRGMQAEDIIKNLRDKEV